MGQIRLTFKPGGQMIIHDDGVTAESAQFTQQLADSVGDIEERHKAEAYELSSEAEQIRETEKR